MDYGFPQTLNYYQRLEMMIVMVRQAGGRVGRVKGDSATWFKLPNGEHFSFLGDEDLNQWREKLQVDMSSLPVTGELGAVDHVNDYVRFCRSVAVAVSQGGVDPNFVSLAHAYLERSVAAEGLQLFSPVPVGKTFQLLLKEPRIAESLLSLAQSHQDQVKISALSSALWNSVYYSGNTLHSPSSFVKRLANSASADVERQLFSGAELAERSNEITDKRSVIDNFLPDLKNEKFHEHSLIRQFHYKLYAKNISVSTGINGHTFSGFEPELLPAGVVNKLTAIISGYREDNNIGLAEQELSNLSFHYRPLVNKRHEDGLTPKQIVILRAEEQLEQHRLQIEDALAVSGLPDNEKAEYLRLLGHALSIGNNADVDAVLLTKERTVFLNSWLKLSAIGSNSPEKRAEARVKLSAATGAHEKDLLASLAAGHSERVTFQQQLYLNEKAFNNVISASPQAIKEALKTRLSQYLAPLSIATKGSLENLKAQLSSLPAKVESLKQEMFDSIKQQALSTLHGYKKDHTDLNIQSLIADFEHKLTVATPAKLTELAKWSSGLDKTLNQLIQENEVRLTQQSTADLFENTAAPAAEELAPEVIAPVAVEPAPEVSTPAAVEPTPEVTAPVAVEPTPEVTAPVAVEPTPEVSTPAAVEPTPEVTAPVAVDPTPEVTAPVAVDPTPEVTAPVAVEPAPEVATPAAVEPTPEVTAPVAVEPAPEVSTPAAVEPAAEASVLADVELASDTAKPVYVKSERTPPVRDETSDEHYERLSDLFYKDDSVYLEDEYDWFNTLWQREVESATHEDQPGRIYAWFSDIENTRSRKDIKAWYEYTAERHQLVSDLRDKMTLLSQGGTEDAAWFSQQCRAAWCELAVGVAETFPRSVSNDTLRDLLNASKQDPEQAFSLAKQRDELVEKIKSKIPVDDVRQCALADYAAQHLGFSGWFDADRVSAGIKKVKEDLEDGQIDFELDNRRPEASSVTWKDLPSVAETVSSTFTPKVQAEQVDQTTPDPAEPEPVQKAPRKRIA